MGDERHGSHAWKFCCATLESAEVAHLFRARGCGQGPGLAWPNLAGGCGGVRVVRVRSIDEAAWLPVRLSVPAYLWCGTLQGSEILA
jgi:hypothetical protein